MLEIMKYIFETVEYSSSQDLEIFDANIIKKFDSYKSVFGDISFLPLLNYPDYFLLSETDFIKERLRFL